MKALGIEVEEAFEELRIEIREMRAEIKSMKRTMIYGFFSLGGLMLTLFGFLLA